MVSQHVNVLNATKLYTLKRFMLFYVNFTSIERGKDCIGEEWLQKGSLFLNSKGVNRQRSVTIRAAAHPQSLGLPIKAVTHGHQDGSRGALRPPYPGLSQPRDNCPVHSASDKGLLPQVFECKAQWLFVLAPAVTSSGHLSRAHCCTQEEKSQCLCLHSCHLLLPLSSQENKTHETKPKQTRPVFPKEKMNLYHLSSGAS